MREIRLDLGADVAGSRRTLAAEAGKFQGRVGGCSWCLLLLLPCCAVLCCAEPHTPAYNFANFREYKLFSRLQYYCHVVAGVNLAHSKGRR